MSRRKQAKPRSLKPEEEEWAEGTVPRENEDALKSMANEDEPEWQQEETNIEEKSTMVEEGENNVEEQFEDGEDTHSPKKHSELQSEDVADIKSESMDSFESDDEEAAAVKRKRRFSVHPTWQKRDQKGEYHTLYKELLDDETQFYKYFTFAKLYKAVCDRTHSISFSSSIFAWLFTMDKDTSTFTGFFNTDHKRIDLVLVTSDKSDHKTEEMRIYFLTNIIKFGLELEMDEGTMPEHKSLMFVKVHAPDSIIEDYGLYFNIRKFFKDTHVEYINPILDPLGMRHEREFIKLVRRQYPGPVNYSTLERSLIVYNIINRLPIGQYENIFGINRLIEQNIILDAFALHDGPYFLTSNQNSTHINARQTLFYNWVGALNIWKSQPIYMIQEYLGERVASYFAFYEYFNFMLLFPAIFGFLITLKHYIGEPRDLDVFSNATCSRKELQSTFICSQCRHFKLCPFRYVPSYCREIKFINRIDTPYSLKFAFWVYIWSIIFVVLWKRREKYLAWMWEIKEKHEENLINPEYHPVHDLRDIRRSYLSGVNYKFNFKMVFIRVLLKLLFAVLFGVWLFGLFVLSTQIWYVKFWLDLTYNGSSLKRDRQNEHLFIGIGAAVYSILTTALKMVAKTLAYCLTALENNETIGSYNCSLAKKLYAYYFTGTFALLTLHVFVGNIFYTHLLDMSNWYSIGGFKVMNNGLGSSFDDICITLAVAILVEQILFKIPFYFWRKGTDYQGIFPRTAPSWEREYKLDTLKDEYFHDYYNDIAIQFALATLFSITFTLSPMLILLINIWDIRHKARMILLSYRRPLLYNSSGPAIWHKIIIITTFFVPIFNLLIIGLQSRMFFVEHVHTPPSTFIGGYKYPFTSFYQKTNGERFELFNSSLGEPSPKGEFEKLPDESRSECKVIAHEYFFYKKKAFNPEYKWYHARANRYEYILILGIVSVLITLFIYFHFPTSNDIEDTLNTEARIKQKYYIQKGFLPNQE